MKKSIIIFAILITSISCKQKEETKVVEKELSIAEKIANANGLENWKNVSQIDFTFNVDKDSTHSERSWSWKPKTNEVSQYQKDTIITYSRKLVDSTIAEVDKKFINDKFWLLAPFQLVWDSGTTFSEPIKESSPINKIKLNKITGTYPNNGGYTPGDAYDFYYDDTYMIKEWIYRKENSTEPNLVTTWENYQDFNGLKIALEHRKSEGNWKLSFTNVKVQMK